MNSRRIFSLAAIAAGCVLLLTACAPTGGPRPGVVSAEPDISGVVTGPRGPEAGVWVIAETSDLPTKFVKIVATDDSGRYVIPELDDGSSMHERHHRVRGRH